MTHSTPPPTPTGAARPSRARARRLTGLAVVAGLGVATVGVATLGPTATAAPANILQAATAKSVSCFAKPLGRVSHAASRSFTASVTGIVQARLKGGGDWDLAVFDTTTKKVVAASAGSRTAELAEGFVTKGQQLTVQGCRYRGSVKSSTLSVEFFAAPAPPAPAGETTQVVEVSTPKRADKKRLQGLGLDLTEHATATTVQVVLHGKADAAKLAKNGFRYTVEIADLDARGAANRAADLRFAARTAVSALPSGRTTYRHLYDYQLEMKQLAAKYPKLVRPLVLPEKTIEGREVEAIEITTNAAKVADGKPVFFNMGVHHAREWPAAEHPMEFAHDLLKKYATDRSVRALVGTARTIVLPVVNPDGFNISREAPSAGATFGVFDYEYKRKNCRPSDSPPAFQGGTCGANPAGRLRGTDPNRNYGFDWGGDGASPVWSNDTYRGSAPFSEPEVRNVRHVVSTRQVTGLITNHTFSNLVLRAPGRFDTRPSLEDATYKALGAQLTARNGYANQLGFELYDTSGSTEDWSYWATGGFGFTFEIGPDEFHPPYATGVVAEYQGLAPAAGAGKGGNRAAYYRMLQASADRRLHSSLVGSAPRGAVVKLRKEFTTPTAEVIQPDGTRTPPLAVTDVLSTSYVSTGGRFRIDTNPSTRPYVAGRLGRDPLAPPQAAITLANPAGVPAENQGNPLTGAGERIPFTVSGQPTADNETATIRIEWASPSTDWDLYILNAKGEVVGASTQGDTTFESARLVNPPAGDYTAVVVNYDEGAAADWGSASVTFAGPKPTTYGPKETWTLTCSVGSTVKGTRQVYVDRAQVLELGDVCRPVPAKAKR